MPNIDEKVVEMKFDNKQFESAASITMQTLEKLKEKLKFPKKEDVLKGVSNAVDRMDFSGLQNGIETINNKFSALGIMGVTVLTNLTNTAVNAGKRIVKALTIDPIKTGFQEYETQINAVQTILANTRSKGTTIDDVNKALDELNVYADKTIYNFTQMTRNIGTFTAAGIGLEESTKAIQGIANLAAVSGSTAQQASTAMYQLSQALASGTVKLQDWNSVVNASMGGQLFQDALKETARAHGVAVDAIIKKEGSFRESLKEGWITAEVLTETLHKMTKSGAAEYLSKLTGIELKSIEAAQKAAEANKKNKDSYEKLAEQMAKTGKITKKEAINILEAADTAEDAATKVKTFTQLWDTLKETAQSGWTQSWEIVIGDFEKAKSLMSDLNDMISPLINKMSDSRNTLLEGWKKGGGRKDAISGVKSLFNNISSYASMIKTSFSDVFPSLTSENLISITSNFKKFAESLKMSSETADKVKTIFKGLFSLLEMGMTIIKNISSAIIKFVKSDGMKSLYGLILNLGESLGKYLIRLNTEFKSSGFLGVLESVATALSSILKGVTGKVESLISLITSIGDAVSKVLSAGANGLTTLFSWFKKNTNVSSMFLGGITAFIGSATMDIGKIVTLVTDFLDSVDNTLNKWKKLASGSIKESFISILADFRNALIAFTQGIKLKSLITIAIAVNKITDAIEKLSHVSIDAMIGPLVTVGVVFRFLTGAFVKMVKALAEFKDIKALSFMLKAGIYMVLMAKAVSILSDSIVKLSSLKIDELGIGLLGVVASMYAMVFAFKIMSKIESVPKKLGINLILIAIACKIVASAVNDLAGLNIQQVGTALLALAGGMFIIVGAFRYLVYVLEKFKKSASSLTQGALAFMMIVIPLRILSKALLDLSVLSVEQALTSVMALGLALAEILAVLYFACKMAKDSAKDILVGALAFDMVIIPITFLMISLKSLAYLTLDDIAPGIIAIGAILVALIGTLAAVSNIAKMGVKNLLVGVIALNMLIPVVISIAYALLPLAHIPFENMMNAVVGIGAVLLEMLITLLAVSVVSTSPTILIGILALDLMIPVLLSIAMSLLMLKDIPFKSIQNAMIGIGAVLGELVVVALAMAGIATIGTAPLLVGAISLLIMVRSLDEIAGFLTKIASISWKKLQNGIKAMMEALLVLAAGGFANALSGLGALSISALVKPVGELVNVIAMFSELDPVAATRSIGLIRNVLKAIGDGGLVNMFSGIGAKAISKMAAPLGTLALSMQLWSKVKVPEDLPKGLGLIAKGIRKLIFTDIGAKNLKDIPIPLGMLAQSVRAWERVTVPDNFVENMDAMGTGIRKLFFTEFGANTIKKIAAPLGILATSVKMWKGIDVPEGLAENLDALAKGVRKFIFTDLGSYSINKLAAPLGTLADSVKKWEDLKLSDNTVKALERLAYGLEPFNLFFTGGYNMDMIVGPLAKLADSVKKWEEVKVSDESIKVLSNIGEALKAFNWLLTAGWSISSIADPLGTLADSVNKWGGVNVASDIGTQFENLSTAIEKFKGLKPEGKIIASISEPLGILADSVKKWEGVAVPNEMGDVSTFSKNLIDMAKGIHDAVKNFTGDDSDSDKNDKFVKYLTSLKDVLSKIPNVDVDKFKSEIEKLTTINVDVESFKKATGDIKTSVSDLVTAISKVVSDNKKSISTLMDGIADVVSDKKRAMYNGFVLALSGITSAIGENSEPIKTACEGLVTKAATAMSEKKRSMKEAFRDVAKEGPSVFRMHHGAMVQAGKYLADGLIYGMSSKKKEINTTAFNLGKGAVESELKGQKSNSPSKATIQAGKYFGEGLIIGIKDTTKGVNKAGYGLGKEAVSSLSASINRLSDNVNSELDITPRIRPILDLTDVKSGASSIERLFSGQYLSNSVITAGSIGRLVDTNQNEYNKGIVDAIDGLRKSFENSPRNNYNINGITYDDGSNVSSAVETLIRAARVERRV